MKYSITIITKKDIAIIALNSKYLLSSIVQ